MKIYYQIETQEEVEVDVKVAEDWSLVVYNDDHNTFDHVIERLVSVCYHTVLQAEQCAVLTHLKGSCVVLTGEIDYLEQFRYDLSLYGLNVEIR